MIHSSYGTKLNNGEDVLYDFLKNEWVARGKILTNFSRQFLKITQSKRDGIDISCPKFLIIDDTLPCKTGKTIEYIGKVFDYCSRTYQLGMKAMVAVFGAGKVLFQQLFLFKTNLVKIEIYDLKKMS